MWRDPMDELIADLEQVAPPEQSKFGGNPEGTSRRCRSGPPVFRRYQNDVDQGDPEVQREVRKLGRAMTGSWGARRIGRPRKDPARVVDVPRTRVLRLTPTIRPHEVPPSLTGFPGAIP